MPTSANVDLDLDGDRRRGRFAAAALALLLAACGGGGGGGGDSGNAGGGSVSPPPVAAECSLTAQKTWLRDYVDQWYFWDRLAPKPDPAPFDSVAAYFAARLFAGDATVPRDRWSNSQSTESFNRFFGDGQTLGYGLFVAGNEVLGRPDQPLRVRYVEPRSDAAARGVLRGEQIVSLNGRPASELIAANDFSVLTPGQAGDTLALVLRAADGSERSVTLAAAVYPLTPVGSATVTASAGGRRIGYLFVKDMLSQARPGLQTAFGQLAAQGVNDLVLDLRYNGGGLVSVGAELASYVDAGRSGSTYAALLYNEQRAASNNQTYRFSAPAQALSLPRVYLLTGSRTCSASEQVINGLRGAGVQVVTIGGTSCGKPVGFLPASQCGTTYNLVNFESVNARNEGRYYDGFAPTCAVADDLTRPLGDPQEALFAAARQHADSGRCPAVATGRVAPQAAGGVGGAVRLRADEGERNGMIAR